LIYLCSSFLDKSYELVYLSLSIFSYNFLVKMNDITPIIEIKTELVFNRVEKLISKRISKEKGDKKTIILIMSSVSFLN